MIVDFGSRSVQGQFKVKVQGETLEKQGKFKQFKVNTTYFILSLYHFIKNEKYKNNKI